MSQELKALQAAEIGLANMVSYQSSGSTPNIHEYGQARRALDAVRAHLSRMAGADAGAGRTPDVLRDSCQHGTPYRYTCDACTLEMAATAGEPKP